MPFASGAGGARIHWSEAGAGEPLVLVMGLGCASALWFRLVPRLARRFRLILLDNRGVGLTEAPNAVVHRVTTLADDVAAVLDAAGEATAHVAGLSMGGMIAQEFALNHPRRLRTLTLMATNCGGLHATLAPPHVWRKLFDKGQLTPTEALEALRPHTYARATPAEVIDEDHRMRLAHYPTLRGYQAQLNGLIGWTSHARLPRISAPTLVLHGAEDQLIPPANGRTLAARIPGSTHLELENASHWLHSDRPAQVAAAIEAFVAFHAA